MCGGGGYDYVKNMEVGYDYGKNKMGGGGYTLWVIFLWGGGKKEKITGSRGWGGGGAVNYSGELGGGGMSIVPVGYRRTQLARPHTPPLPHHTHTFCVYVLNVRPPVINLRVWTELRTTVLKYILLSEPKQVFLFSPSMTPDQD